MMPQFKYTEITSYSGNTKIYIFRKYKKKKAILERKKFLRQQKLIGVGLIIISVVGFLIFPEDNGAFVMSGLMGIARTFCE